ncbi:MAG: TerC/Alx family metal homeostasis membrane protein [Actinomycetota bacterium]
MDNALWEWLALGAVVVALLAVDLALFGRGGREITLRAAAAWSGVWMALGLLFTAAMWWRHGGAGAEEYLAGFLIEKSLSVDNLFVFSMVFAYFGIPAQPQRRVMFWGIAGAIVLRGLFIAAGAALLDAAHWTIYVFGAFLVVTGIRMARHGDTEIHPQRNVALRALGRLMPLSHDLDGDRFLVRVGARRAATPLLAALVLVATFDVLFAADSIPAIFAVTDDAFVVAAANAFSLLGLGALYFVLAGMMDRFRHLDLGLAVILVLVGTKMLLADVYAIPVYLSLAAIVAVLAVAITASLITTRGDGRAVRSPAET